MSVGLIALLDDVAAIAKSAATSIDKVAGAAAKAGVKSAGVVIDDAAVTPRYVVGFAADRELPIIAKIAKGSLKNKLLVLLPAALLLSFFAPWAVTPLLMLGGAYLCYEGAEKVYEALVPHAAHAHEDRVAPVQTPQELEDFRVTSAIRTDFILSAEIMAIALATVTDSPFVTQAFVLALVGLFITLGVYGAVALIVRADDMGMALARSPSTGMFGRSTRALGRGVVASMPWFLNALAIVGTAAMIWVGGGILIHGLATYGVTGPEHVIHDLALAAGAALPTLSGGVAWLVGAAAAGIVGLLCGLILIPVVGRLVAPLWRRLRGKQVSDEATQA